MASNIERSNEILSRFAGLPEKFKINEACECLSGEVCTAIDNLSITIADEIDRENDEGTPLNIDGQIQKRLKVIIEKMVQAVIEFKVLGDEHREDVETFIDIADSVLMEIIDAVHDLNLVKTLSETLSYYTGKESFRSYLEEQYKNWGTEDSSYIPEPATRSRLQTLGFEDGSSEEEYSVEGDRDSVEVRTDDTEGFGLRREVTEAPGRLGPGRPRVTQQWSTRRTDIGLGDELRAVIAKREAERIKIPGNPIPDLRDTGLADLEQYEYGGEEEEKAPDTEKNFLDAIDRREDVEESGPKLIPLEHEIPPANQNQSEDGVSMDIEDEVTSEYFEEPAVSKEVSEIPPMPEPPAMITPSEEAALQAANAHSPAPQNLGSTMISDTVAEAKPQAVSNISVEEAVPEELNVQRISATPERLPVPDAQQESSPESAVFTARWVKETDEGRQTFPNGVQNGYSTGQLPNINPLAEVPKEEDEPAPFTRRWAEKQGGKLPSVIIQTKGKVDEDGPKSIPTKEVMNGTRLPSSYLPSTETTKITRRPQPTPDTVQGKTRSNVWKWAGGVALIAGLGGVFAGALTNSGDDVQKGGVGGVNSSSILAGGGLEDSETGPSRVDTEDSQNSKAAKAGEYESGEFRVNSSHPDYQKFVCGPIRSASKLVSTLDEATANSRISYIQDPAAYKLAKEKGIPVLSGKEGLEEQRIIIAKVILGNAISQSGNHVWMRGYFSDMLESIKEREKTGNWGNKVKTETKQFLEAINADKFVRTSEIVGYAPNPDPSSNPGLKKLMKFAPTYGHVVREIFARMNTGIDAAPYGNFISIKETVIAALKKEIEKSTGNKRSGLVYMLGKTGTLTCDPVGFNLLDQALTQITEVKAAATIQKPNTVPTPTENPNTKPDKKEVAPKSPTPSPTGNNIHERQRNNFNIPTNAVPVQSVPPSQYAQVQKTQKPGLLSRVTNKVKSFLGFGKKSDPTQQFASEVAELRRQARGEFTKKDIPVKSIGKSISEMFWG